MTNTETTRIHPFEASGFGKAPFRFTHVTRNVYSAAPGHSQPGGTCDYCGNGIMWECHIKSADGRAFKVGSDCVAKVDGPLSRRVNAGRKAYQTPEQLAAQQAAQAARDAKNAARKAEADLRQQALEVEMRQAEIDNRELIRVFRELSATHNSGGFISDMYGQLMTTPFARFSIRQKDCIADIYARTFGRRGSKAYDAAHNVAMAHDPTWE